MLFMVINASEPPLDNKLIRQALNHAIDQKALVEQLYRGRAIALRAGMQETIPEINRSLAGYPYDPQKARDLLKQAGYKGQPIRVNAPTQRITLDKELGEAVAGMLEKVGRHCRAQGWPSGATYAQPLLAGKALGGQPLRHGEHRFLSPEWVFTLWLLPGGQGEVYTKGRPANWEKRRGPGKSPAPRAPAASADAGQAPGRGARVGTLDPPGQPEGHLRAQRPRELGAVCD